MKASNLFRVVGTAALVAVVGTSALALNISKTEFVRSNPKQVKLTITPQTSNNLDLLFVVDDSGSMESVQQKLSAGVVSLTKSLQTNFASSHVAVITTTNANFFGKNTKVVSAGGINANADLADNFLVGTQGSADENVFGNVMSALSAPLIDNENKNFLRSEAHLGVFVVTDTEDQSKTSAADFVGFLNTLKGNSGFTMNAFLADSADLQCAGEDLAPVKLTEAVNLSGGKIFNICKDDFAQGLQNFVGTIVNVFSKTIKLPYTPVLSSVEVKIGSYVLTFGDMNEGWVYNSKENSIILGSDIQWSQIPMADMEISFEVKK